jgi:AcrR family transcriptional regulator
LSDIHKDELIKAAIVKAAENLFQKWGINKTTMEDIAKASGKGKSTLYYYFKSKEEIFDVVLMKEMMEVFDLVKVAVANAKTFETKMRTYVLTNLQELRKRVNIYSIVRAEISQNEDFIKKVRTLFDTEEINLIKEILNFGTDSEELRNFTNKEINSLSHIIMIAFRSIEMDLFIDHKFFNDDEKIDSLIDILIRGVKK